MQVAASLLDGLVKGRVGDVGPFALDDEVGHLHRAVGVNHQVGVVVGRPPGHVDLKGNQFRRVLVLVNQFRPQLGADFLLRIAPPFGVSGGDIVDALAAPIAGNCSVAVGQGAGKVRLGLEGGGHVGNPAMCRRRQYTTPLRQG